MYDKDKIKGIREYREEQEAWEARKREEKFDEALPGIVLVIVFFSACSFLWYFWVSSNDSEDKEAKDITFYFLMVISFLFSSE